MGEATTAPWTAEQVDALNAWQTASMTHPFTCGRCRDAGVGGECALTATTAGWVCDTCDYTQDWAHDFMLGAPHQVQP